MLKFCNRRGAMSRTFTEADFVQALSSGTLQEAVELAGVVKRSDDNPKAENYPVCAGHGVGRWVPIPSDMIDWVEWLSKVPGGGHVHEYVRPTLKGVSSPEANVLASLLFGLTLLLGGLGCAGYETQVERPESALTKAPPARSHTGTVHATLSIEKGHYLQFVEFTPGVTGVVEVGRTIVDKPVVTDELKKLDTLALYRHFAGANGSPPKSLVAAQAHASAKEVSTLDAPPPSSASNEAASGQGRHRDTSDEQNWFRHTFCNGAQDCIQGWDWATIPSRTKISHGEGIAMVGSEGTTDAKFDVDYRTCVCLTPFCLGGPSCFWFQLWHALVVPGHWVSIHVNGVDDYVRWDLNGAGEGTQVSLAARYSYL